MIGADSSSFRAGRLRLLTLCFVLVAVATVTVASAADKRVPRPMQIHRVEELGLEIWTEKDPEWETRIERLNGQPIFHAETPALTYPPAGMSWVSAKGIRFSAENIKEGALGAIHQAAMNYGVKDLQAIALTERTYGDLQGYEAVFSATAHGTAVDVRIFFGHQAGKPAVLVHAYTLQGKLEHISEQVRRSWSNLRYLKRAT